MAFTESLFTDIWIIRQAVHVCMLFMTSSITVKGILLREELLVAAMFGDSHSQRAVAGAPELGLGGQQMGGLQGVSLQPLLQLLLYIAHISPVTPALKTYTLESGLLLQWWGGGQGEGFDSDSRMLPNDACTSLITTSAASPCDLQASPSSCFRL